MSFRAALTAPLVALLALLATPPPRVVAADAEAKAGPSLLAPASVRYADESCEETPDFQRHVLPLMGRLGCNSRSCHGSFQGRGGFRLSLFGYDFKADHEALLDPKADRIDREAPELSKLIQKPTLEIPHKGGELMKPDTWQYRMFLRWLEKGAKGVENSVAFTRLEVSPSELVFEREGQTVPLKVVAHWADGTTEDVTCISRFRTNDEAIAEIDEHGVVTSKGPGDTHVVAFYDNGVAVTQVIRPVSEQVGPKYPDVPTPTRIDALVVEKLRKLGVVPSEVCTDGEFLRRVCLDLIGTLPTPAEVEAFLADSSPAKREAKVDELLSRPSYAAQWATKLCDYTGANSRMFNGDILRDDYTRDWYEWVARRLRENVTYDKIVAGIVLASSRKPGQKYEDFIKEQGSYYRDKDKSDFSERDTMPYYWARRNVNQPQDKALNFSYAFLGVRLECAQCHKHPFDQWTQDDFKQFTAFFTPIRYGIAPDARSRVNELREELGLNKLMGGQAQRETGRLARQGKLVPWQEVFVVSNANRRGETRKKDKNDKNSNNRVANPKLLGGETVDLADASDPRQPLMAWLRSKDNPFFARAIVNRIWTSYFGRGIVSPPDDMNLANPPSNAPLLDYLVKGFIEHEFDLKWLHREIVLSQTYQRSWKTNATNRLDEKNFSHASVRRLPAEVLLDAVQVATASTKDLLQANTLAGLEDRAIGPKGGLTSRRGIGQGEFASRVFGRSPRDTNCDCAASNDPNLLQSIYLQNDGEMLSAIDRRGGWLDERTGMNLKSTRQAREAAERAVATLTRRIEELEAQAAKFREQDKEKAIADTELQLSKRRDDLASAQKRLAALDPLNDPAPFEPEAVVREAYLRTLSRLPTEAEAARARNHLEAAGEPATGLRDLLWALLNTKEFITNH